MGAKERVLASVLVPGESLSELDLVCDARGHSQLRSFRGDVRACGPRTSEDGCAFIVGWSEVTEPPNSVEDRSTGSRVAGAVMVVFGFISILVSLPFVTNECRPDRPLIRGDVASSVCITARESGKVVLWFGIILLVGGFVVLLVRGTRKSA